MEEAKDEKDVPSFLAHVAPEPDIGFRLHSLSSHLQAVSDLAADLAEPFGASEWARLAGRWHDLGKFQPAFQAYIRRGSGYDQDAHLEDGTPGRVDHSTVGAIHAVRHLETLGKKGKGIGRMLAYVIAGHHAGLPDWHQADGGQASLAVRLEGRAQGYRTVRDLPAALPWIQGEAPPGGPPSRGAVALWLRMLFSALVDADFLDTEAFMDGEKPLHRAGWKPLSEIAKAFDSFMAKKARQDSSVNQVRTEVLSQCRAAGDLEPGLFSLTVPTGGGKTLSSMAFALRHTLRHRKRRIIYVIPYTSILEQTVDVFREALGEDEAWTVLLEHHSSLDPDRDTPRSRLAAENWDAPVVVTTSVQFFESLFASRTSRTRKLHNLADSVVILDEVQLLPAEFLAPFLDVLRALASHFGATILLMTATQPAWQNLGNDPTVGLPGVREIVPDPMGLHGRLARVRVDLPDDLSTQTPWRDISDQLMEHPSVLCVVNRRQDARVLHELLRNDDPGAIHLSALMCGAHRSAVIKDIRRRLDAGQAVRVVSTQLVEAGVDLDFPVVFRALAGLDSIAQAAGRCNREGKARLGQVRIFVPPTSPPPGILRRAEGVARSLIAEGISDPLAPETFQRFFKQLYWLQGERLDKHDIRGLLDHGGQRLDLSFAFRTAAAKVRIIPEDGQMPVVVDWPGHPKRNLVEDAIKAIRFGGAGRGSFRALQRSIVTVPMWHLGPLLVSGAIEALHERLHVQVDSTLYDEDFGLRLDPSDIRDPEDLHV